MLADQSLQYSSSFVLTESGASLVLQWSNLQLIPQMLSVEFNLCCLKEKKRKAYTVRRLAVVPRSSPGLVFVVSASYVEARRGSIAQTTAIQQGLPCMSALLTAAGLSLHCCSNDVVAVAAAVAAPVSAHAACSSSAPALIGNTGFLQCSHGWPSQEENVIS